MTQDRAALKAFVTPPVVMGPWHPVPEPTMAALIERLRETVIDGVKHPFGTMRLRPLGFWPGWMLIELQVLDDHARASEGETVLTVVFGPDGFSPLNTGPRTFHHHAELHGADFTSAEDCLAYLQLYTAYAFDPDGPHWLLWPEGAVQGQTGEGVLHRPAPVRIDLGSEPPSTYDRIRAPAAAVMEAEVLVAGRIDRCRFRLDQEGVVTILSSETLVAEASLVPQIRLQGALRSMDRPRQEEHP